MTKKELQKRLVDEYFRKDSYSLENGLPNDAFCLDTWGGKWEIYFSERGEKSIIKTFESEDEACEYFYSLMSTNSDLKWHTIGFFREEDQALSLMDKLSDADINYKVQQIPYAGPKDWRYVVLVFGSDIARVQELGIANEIFF